MPKNQKMANQYAVLMETSPEDCESWYYFIKYNGNEDALKNLKAQFDKIEDAVIIDDINLFDLDIENLVSEECAKQLCMLELNSVTYHRKFDGVLENIDFRFKKKDDDETMMFKIFDKIGEGDIDLFLTLEDIPESHKLDENDMDLDRSGDDRSDDDRSGDDRSDSESDDDSDGEDKKEMIGKVPPNFKIKKP
jgi:hypothetical protein